MSAQPSFWARRMAGLKAEQRAEARAALAAEDARREAELAGKDDAEILEEMGLPDPSAMQAGDDFAAFMQRAVPEHLRKQALRSLWRSNPVLACVDGLNDYDDDYRAAALARTPFKTAYQVGKGMTAHVEEMARLAAQKESGVDENHPAPEEQGATVAMAEVEIAPDADPSSEIVRADAGERAEATPDAPAPAPRRMRFRFEEESA